MPDDIDDDHSDIPDAGNQRLMLRSALEAGQQIGPAFDPAQLRQILTNLEKRGVVVDSGPDAIRFLATRGAAAMYIAEHGRPGVLLLRPGATRVQVVEELVHHGQHVRARYCLAQDTVEVSLIRARRELDAQSTLLAIARRQAWTAEEIGVIERNYLAWQELYNRIVNR